MAFWPPMKRRQFFRAAASGLSLAASGCGKPLDTATESASAATPLQTSRAAVRSQREFQGQTLKIFVYSGFCEQVFREFVGPRLERLTGCRVTLDPGWWDAIPKIKASPAAQPPYDLVITDATQGYPAIREGLFQKLELKRIGNLQKLSPRVLDHWVYREGYGVTFPDSVMTLAYDRRETHFEPAGWHDLLRDEARGKVGLYNSLYMSLYTFACIKAAMQGKPGTAHAELERDAAGVMAFAREHRRAVGYWWPTATDMVLNLSQQNCALGNMHSPEMLTALRQKPELAAVVPALDRAFVQLMWLVPAGSSRRELAEQALDVVFSEEVQEEFARRGASSSILSVARRVAKDDPQWGQLYPSTAEQLERLEYYPYDAYFREWTSLVEAWDRTVLRAG